MSEIKVNSIKGVGASDAAITVNNTDGTCTANITNNLSNRRLTINGDMKISQRGTSSTVDGYGTIDRFASNLAGCDENPTQSQSDVASGTTPYTLGFRKAFKFTNGNQTSVGTTDTIAIVHKLEAQDIANSGWNYTSASSYVTLSFWVKSSVAQNFYARLVTEDGTDYNYPIETGSLTADTWTKITKTIPGNSNLQFDNDANKGLTIEWIMFRGTSRTGSVSLDAWAVYDSSVRVPDMTSTWYTTNDATFELTGVQLEVSDHATDFEHRSSGQELKLCERYYQILAEGAGKYFGGTACNYMTNYIFLPLTFKTEMRVAPTMIFAEGSNYYQLYDSGNTSGINFNRPSTWDYSNRLGGALTIGSSHISGATNGNASLWYAANAAALIAFDSEL